MKKPPAPKSILITGASRGIGRSLCEAAIQRGHTVHALVRRADQAPRGTQAHVGDIRDRESVRKLMSELAPTIDWYLANAGVGHNLNPSKPDAADLAAEVMEINGTATVFSMYALAYEWIQLGEAARGRRIAVVSSLAAGLGLPRSAVYAASKTAQLIACQGLEHDLARNGIHVSVIQPGFIETEMSAHLKDRPFLISAEAAAERIFKGLERGSHRIAFPSSTAGLAWLGNHVPSFVMRTALRQLEKKGMF